MTTFWKESDIPPHLQKFFAPAEIGLEKTPAEYVANLVEVFSLVWEVLADDGVLWLNLGDSYFSTTKGTGGSNPETSPKQAWKSAENGQAFSPIRISAGDSNCKPKDLIGIPWRVAFALQEAGWYLRQDIIWCLSGGTWLYARTQKGDMPIMVKDLSRLDPETVKLWNGEKWTRLLGMSRSDRRGDELEIVLRSGERISCTPTHRFPTNRGLLDASDLRPGDCLQSCRLPEPDEPRDCSIDEDAAWFAGLYLAEGSMSEDTIQIAGHAKEAERWDRVQHVAAKFGGSAARTIDGNNMSIRVYGRVIVAIVRELVSGKTAIDKGFASVVWRYSDEFISAMLDGYLSGDGHRDGNRWRLGFCRNYNLERDLRVACARLGYTLTLGLATTKYDGKDVPTFRGELRKERSGHRNEKNRNEVVEIRKARCRQVYDLGVEDEPHLFSMASGVLTHNSKPNPMPESVKDRCTKAHEYLFLLTKRPRYYFDAEAIKEPSAQPWRAGKLERSFSTGDADRVLRQDVGRAVMRTDTRNRRSVWTIPTKPYKGAHFAVFPPALVEPCILAGSRPGDTVLDPFFGSGTVGEVAQQHGRRWIGCELNKEYEALQQQRIGEFQ